MTSQSGKQRHLLAAVAATAVVLAATAGASAAVVGITTDSNADLGTLTVWRGWGPDRTYDAADLDRIDVTEYAADGKARIFVRTSEGDPGASHRAEGLEDLNFERGFNNASAWWVNFTTPVVNSDGADVVLFDWGSSDAIEVTANSQTKSYVAGDYDGPFYAPGGDNFGTDILESDVAVPNLTTLESGSTSFAYDRPSNAGVGALAIDLSDFGVPKGGTITNMSFADPSPSSIDPLVIVGLPEVVVPPGPPGLIDDFQAFSVGDSIGGFNGWTAPSNQTVVADPTDAANHVLSAVGSNNNIFKAADLSDGLEGSLRFRFYVPGDTDEVDLNVSLSDVPNPGAASDGSTVLRIVNGSLQAHDGTFKTLDSYETDTWYSVQMLIDNAADSWQAMIKGGSWSDWTLLESGGDDTFVFRHGAGNSDLVNFYVRTNNAHGGDVAYLDDIFQTEIIPEPSSLLVFVGLGLIGLFGCCRRAKR